jgi:hypothetical protein
MDIAKATPEFIADYFNYLLAFSLRPGDTINSYTEHKEGEQPRLSRQLILFSLLSVGISVVIVQIGAAAGMADDRSAIVVLFGRIENLYLPVAALLLIVAIGAMAHVMLRVVSVLGALLGHERFTGSVANTINASIGFASWGIPAMTAVVVAVRIAAHRATINPIVFIIVVGPLSLAVLFYFTAAFAAAHRVSLQKAGSLLALLVAVVVIVQDVLESIVGD